MNVKNYSLQSILIYPPLSKTKKNEFTCTDIGLIYIGNEGFTYGIFDNSVSVSSSSVS